MKYHSSASYTVLRQRDLLTASLPNICTILYTKPPHFLHYSETPPRNLCRRFHDLCPQCWNTDLRIDVQKGLRICHACGLVIEENVNPTTAFTESHGEAFPLFLKNKLPRKRSHNLYKRTHHFKTWIARLQGKENFYVPPEILTQLRDLMRRYHVSDPSFQEIRFFLKQLRLSKYYNHAYLLIFLLTGTRVVDLKVSHEKKLVAMFIKIQTAFAEQGGTRVNMLSYSYLLKKMAEHYGWADMYNEIASLKSSVKLSQQDALWRRICRDIHIDFRRSTF